MHLLRRLFFLLLSVGVLWLGGSQLLEVTQVVEGPPGPDVAPLYLGGWALHGGLDPADREVQEQMWARHGSGRPPGQLFMPYPTTAAMMAMPMAWRRWEALGAPFWGAMRGALVVAGLLLLGLGSRAASASAAVMAAGAGLLALAGLAVVPHCLKIGQVNPLIVLLTVGAAVLYIRGMRGLAGAVIGLGAGLKFFPILLAGVALPQRNWRMWAGLGLVGGILALITFSLLPSWSPLGDLSRMVEQVTVAQATAHPPFGGWWARRGILALPLALGLLALVWWRVPEGVDARHAAVLVVLAWGGLTAGGLSPPHEILLLSPALLLGIGWLALEGWRFAPFLAAGLLTLAPYSVLDRYPLEDFHSQVHGIWLIALTWGVAVSRVLLLARRAGAAAG